MNKIPLFTILAALFATGCNTFEMVYEPVRYTGEVTVESEKSFQLTVETIAGSASGTTMSIPVGGVFVPFETSGAAALQFDHVDQIEFGNNLSAELIRLGILSGANSQDGEPDLQLRVKFIETLHLSARQNYRFKAELHIDGSGGSSRHTYEVNSKDGESFGKQWSMNAFDAQRAASEKLLSLMISDVQAFIDN